MHLVLTASAGALVSPLAFARREQLPANIVNQLIDGLGFPGGVAMQEGAPLLPLELEHIAASGLVATHLTVGAVGSMPSLEAFEKAVRDIANWERQIDLHPGVLSRVRNVADIDTARRDGSTGFIYGLQDGVLIEDDLNRMTALHQLGVRIIQPTYNRRNLLGDGCMEPADAGLSRDGITAIERMNELGILIDLSHCGHRTAADAIRASSRPVSFTHTGCDALAPHPRHRSDAEIKAVADSGGVTGIFIMPYLDRGKQPTAASVIEHIEHALDIGGEDHVAIGTDGNISPTAVTDEFVEHFRETTRKRKELGIAAPYETETGYLFASDLNTPERFLTLAKLLLERGHSEERVGKIMGGNLQRVFADTW